MAIEGTNWFDSNSTTQYDHIKTVDSLPRQIFRDERVVRRGYAVGLTVAGLGQTWFFFHHRPPAVAFGRAARMSITVSGWGVYNAATEVKYDRVARRDIHTLHIHPGTTWGGSAQPSDEDLPEWVAGCNPASSSWDPDLAAQARRLAST
ncbi:MULTISPECIES: hypothetical protein [unclassified Streptomyces]|uniref:hypothetical protein n=1 Tax=unclassified Streptomyces TaxID=2593676 RepID=UPI00236709C5|nr:MULTISPECIES: hypothetical protein [unclassified Streptomyces]MDF3144159.1 hypothetical protein [Streptomyces sp. T21Q-yed]WDF45088.1 hypothetical protein PBV52_51225 [Streptomyces sp. T12]